MHDDTPSVPHSFEPKPETLIESAHTPESSASKAAPHGTDNPSFIGEVLRLGIIALIIVLPFRLYIATPFQVSGSSMSPTFGSGDYLIVDRLSYDLEAPTRGDVVVFEFPKDPSKYFIKRLIAFPEEKVTIRGSQVSITTKTGEIITLEEPYIAPENASSDALTLTLGPEEYFVLGDNRIASADSRVWGPVPREDIIGRVFLRLLPIEHIGIFPGAYGESAHTAGEGQ